MKILISTMLILIFSCPAFSQRDTGSTTVITFDDNTSFDDYGTGNLSRNILKIDLFAMVVGDYSIYFERAINSKMGLEIGLGITGKNHLFDLWNNSSDQDDELSRYYGAYSISNPLGTTAKVGMKFYPGSYAPEDFFLQIQYAFRQYNEEYTFDTDPILIETEPILVQHFFNEFKLLFGYAFFLGSSDHWISEYYGGLGTKFRYYSDINVRDTGDQNSLGMNLQEVYTNDVSDMKITLYIGWKLGYAF